MFWKNNLFFGNKTIKTNLIFSLLINAGIWIWLYAMITPKTEPIALRYTIYFGVDLIGQWWYVFIFPAIGFIIIILNLILGYLFFLKVKILAYFLMLSMTACQIILGILAVLITLLNN